MAEYDLINFKPNNENVINQFYDSPVDMKSRK